jgi:hypothetical protein
VGLPTTEVGKYEWSRFEEEDEEVGLGQIA